MLQKLVRLAAGIAVVGTIGVNIAWRKLQSVHRNREYCAHPLKALEENEAGMKLLGGRPIKVRRINLRLAEINSRRAKLTIPVEGRTKKAEIFAMSTREGPNTDWFLQYAIMKVVQGPKQWIIWLHPTDGQFSDIPSEIQVDVSK